MNANKIELKSEKGEYFIKNYRGWQRTSKENFEVISTFSNAVVENPKPSGKLKYMIYKDDQGRRYCRGNEAHFTPDKKEFDVTGKQLFEVQDIVEKRSNGQEFTIDRLSFYEPYDKGDIDQLHPLNEG